MARKITNTKAAWEYLGELFEMCEHFEFPTGTMLEWGICDLVDSYHSVEPLRKMLVARVNIDVIYKMQDEMKYQLGSAYLGPVGAGYAERAMFCYLMAEVGTLPKP